jgi:hypothetical protein
MLKITKKQIKKNKKSQVGSMFNWFIIAIIGSILILFFISLSFNFGRIFNKQTIKESTNSLKSSMKLISGVPNQIFETRYSKYDYRYSCNIDAKKASFRFEDYTADDLGLILFSPQRMNSPEYILFSKQWKLSFPVTNFVYLVNKDIKFVFINSTLTYPLYEMFPNENLNSKLQQNPIKIINEKLSTVVYIGTNNDFNDANNNDLKGSAKNIYFIEINSNDLSYGDITSHKLIGNNFEEEQTSKFIGKESLLGAIVSFDDLNNYECSMSLAFQELNIPITILQERINKLHSPPKEIYGNTEVGSQCQTYLKNINNSFIEIQNNYLNDLFENTNVEELSKITKGMDENVTIMYNKNCASVY